MPGRFVLALDPGCHSAATPGAGTVRASGGGAGREERFRTAFEHAAIGMSVARLDGRFLQVNAALCTLTGYSEAELLARTFQEITYPEDLATDQAQLDRLLAGEIPAFHREKRYLRKDGAVIWIRLNTALNFDEHDMPLHFIGQVEDITARIEAEAAFGGPGMRQMTPTAVRQSSGINCASSWIICQPGSSS